MCAKKIGAMPSGTTGWNVASPVAISFTLTMSVFMKWRIRMPVIAMPMMRNSGK